MGSSIEIHCQKCHKRDTLHVGHGFMSSSIDGTEITEDNKSLVQEFVPKADYATFEKITQRKHLFVDLHNGEEIYKCNNCAVLTNATRLVIRDREHNVVYDAMLPKCPKCHRPMELVNYSVKEDMEPTYAYRIECDLGHCLACGGEVKVVPGRECWD